VLGGAPNPLLDVLAAHAQAGAIGSETPDHDVNMGMFGVVMFDRNPFEAGTEVLPHTFH
jgi:hypothetical protein